MTTPLRIGTRKSALALWQADHVADLLALRGHDCEIVPISTEGDRILYRPLAEIGGKGLFVKELEDALEQGRCDLAVHSAKDVPYELPAGLRLCALPPREDARDALVSPRFGRFADLPQGARLGTSSLRRAMQLLAVRPDLQIVPVRGNVQTRLNRAELELDGVVLALAGLRRLGLEGRVTEVLPVELSLPSAGQGAIAIEAAAGSRGEDAALPLGDARTARCVLAERALLRRLSGGCTLPVAAYAVEDRGDLWLRARIGGPDGRGGVRLLHAEERGRPVLGETLGHEVAELLLRSGAGPLLDASRQQQEERLAAPLAG